MTLTQIQNQIFSSQASNFEELCLQLFRLQASQVPIYKQYIKLLGLQPDSISEIYSIPYLPISFFKTHRVFPNSENNLVPQTIFESSTTTSTMPSKHHILYLPLYEKSFQKAFQLYFGSINQYCILGLLPTYLERQNSSLVYMVNNLIQHSLPGGGFYLYNHESLKNKLLHLEANKIKTILFGTTHALLDFADFLDSNQSFHHLQIIETGGMKGRREELSREEVHRKLKKIFGLKQIQSEYGMTELLSQSYALTDGIYHSPPWKKILCRDINDPFAISNFGRGALNIIDLANVYSCAFIATEDLGEVFKDGTFTVNGRVNQADLRGCSLMTP